MVRSHNEILGECTKEQTALYELIGNNLQDILLGKKSTVNTVYIVYAAFV